MFNCRVRDHVAFLPTAISILAKATSLDGTSTIEDLAKGQTLSGYKYATTGQFTENIQVLDVVVRGSPVPVKVAHVQY